VLLPTAVLGSVGLNVLPASVPLLTLPLLTAPDVFTPFAPTAGFPEFIELRESVETAPLRVLMIDPEAVFAPEVEPVLPVEPATDELPLLRLAALLENDPWLAVELLPNPVVAALAPTCGAGVRAGDRVKVPPVPDDPPLVPPEFMSVPPPPLGFCPRDRTPGISLLGTPAVCPGVPVTPPALFEPMPELAELLAADDVEHLAAAMEPGSTAGVLIWENLWAAPFASAARRAGGQLIANGRIPIQAIIASIEADEASGTEGD